MERNLDAADTVIEPPQGGRFSWPRLAAWLIAAPLVGAIAAWGAMIGQSYWAPLGLFPILVGVGLGAMLVGLMRVAQIGHQPTLFAGAVLAVAVAVAGEHYLSFHELWRRYADRPDAEALQQARAKAPELFEGRRIGPPDSFLQYMQEQAALGLPLVAGRKATGSWAWMIWAIDGLLVLGAAIAVMIPAARQPYCDRCRTWYRTIRSGRIPPRSAAGLAELVRAELGENVKSARCRLSNCSGGCGPTRLELSWEEPHGQTFLTTAWLDADGCDRAGRILDGA
jgi:hypothetical protein